MKGCSRLSEPRLRKGAARPRVEAQAIRGVEHPLWKEIAETAKGRARRMDFIDYRLVGRLREGSRRTSMHDAAAISAVVGPSVQSVGRKSAPVDS